MDLYEITEVVNGEIHHVAHYHPAPFDQAALFETLMRQPAQSPVNLLALDKLVLADTATLPTETLQTVLAAQQRDHHNAKIERRNAKRREIKELARQAGMSTVDLKRMLGRK